MLIFSVNLSYDEVSFFRNSECSSNRRFNWFVTDNVWGCAATDTTAQPSSVELLKVLSSIKFRSKLYLAHSRTILAAEREGHATTLSADFHNSQFAVIYFHSLFLILQNFLPFRSRSYY